ncbi:hypothetical protein [Breznakiella homolactica]|uniref:Uncharacterized protein n=1 Tax=Breznakiella homolactica TaxID=2798577 RepID=A0A7T7XJJ6_9SPIR|nr:hypothetical protein [Breznakiella homolactica]QQO07590.1 hypothetical protein JFL75_11600 [Breznakiella homolactica]
MNREEIPRLLALDKTLYDTWTVYGEILDADPSGPEAAAVDRFADALLADSDFILCCGHWQFMKKLITWSAARDRQDFLKTLAPVVWEFYSGRLHELRAHIEPYMPPKRELPKESVPAIIDFRYKTLAAKRTADALCEKRVWLPKGTEACQYSLFHDKKEHWFSTSAERFESDPRMVTARKRFETDTCLIYDFLWGDDRIESPALHSFLVRYDGHRLTRSEIAELITAVACQRAGAIHWDMTANVDGKYTKIDPFPHEANCPANREIFTLLYILKKCGYMEDVLNLLPRLPREIPLLLMCLDVPAIRERVESHLRIPGLKAAYDMALAPKKCTLKEQLKLVEFGRANPEFQELLAFTLNRYGYYSYNNYQPVVDWFCREYAPFSMAHGADILCFLTSRADLLDTARVMLEHGPETRFGTAGFSNAGFSNIQEYLTRCVTGYLAMTGSPELDEWLAFLKGKKWREESSAKIKLFDFVEALRRQTG